MVAELLRQPSQRLVTLTGPGGVGKTRLALAVAAALSPELGGAARFVSFASVLDPALVPSTVARALGMPDVRGQDPLDQLATALGDRALLLVLDNLEHLLPAAPWVADMLQACPDLKVLATSRERLRIGGEQEFPVPPLALPEATTPSSLEAVAENAAVRLFAARAQAVEPAFTLTAENRAAVAEICRRLDGLPLAIELAAARVKVLPPGAMLVRLEKRLPLLIGGSRDAPARQQTMRDAISWSYGLLSPEEQTLFRRLAVFFGGCTLEAAEWVSDAPSRITDRPSSSETFELVTSLTEKSLLHRVDQAGAEPRFTMLETVREFAHEQLLAHGDIEALRQRHAENFLRWAEEIAPYLESGTRGVWLQRLEADHDNLRAALAWSQEDPVRGELGLRAAAALLWFWYIRGHLAEGRRWLEDILALTEETGTNNSRAQALYASGRLAWRHGDFPLACERLEASIARWRAIGDRRRLAYALSFLGLAGRSQQWDVDVTRSLQAESVNLFREIGDRWGLAMALYNLADGYGLWAGDDPANRDVAEALFAESLALFLELDDAWGAALDLTSMGHMAHSVGNYQKARAHLERGLAALRDVGDIWRIAQALHYLGSLAEDENDLGTAAAYLAAAAGHYRDLGHRGGLSETIGNLAQLARRLGEVQLADQLDSEMTDLHQGTTLVRLSDEDIHHAAARLQTAAEERCGRATETTGQLLLPSPLTERELEVLRLIAGGRSNAEIAQALYISPRTASTHAAHILAKIGLATRAELIAFAHAQSLA